MITLAASLQGQIAVKWQVAYKFVTSVDFKDRGGA
jgi:hypothetical protein